MGSQEVVGYPRDGTGAMEAGATGCLGMSRDSQVGSGRLAGGARYHRDCGTSRYVGKGLDPKRETSCTAGGELYHGGVSCTVGDELCCRR